MAETGTAIDQIANIPEIAFTLHAFPSCTAPVDTTLTLAEQAADAKATGDAVSELRANVADTEMALMDDYLHISPQEIPAAKKRNVQSELGLVDLIYPVGAFYISFSNVSPGTLFSGTQWEQIRDCFLFAADNARPTGSTGGSATHVHTISSVLSNTSLTAKQTGVPKHAHDGNKIRIPEHEHSFSVINHQVQLNTIRYFTKYGHDIDITVVDSNGERLPNTLQLAVTKGQVSDVTNTPIVSGGVSQSAEGESGATHNHTLNGIGTIVTMPSYVAVNVWKRTA